MGQRAFRGRLTDSIIKNYLHNSSENSDYSTTPSTGHSNSIEDSYFSGKLIDLNLEFNLDNPLKDINDINTTLNRGILNSHIPKGTKINNLYLTIKSNNFGQGKILLHSNLYVLFGSYFIRDIKNIYIKLYNPTSKNYYNDRKTINNILEYMCFKTIKVVQINNCLMYYIIPEYSEFAIVLAYRDVNFYEENSFFSFNSCLEDLLFHPYCIFEMKQDNFYKCLNAIERTVPKEVNNIILPVIHFNVLSEKLFEKDIEIEREGSIIFGDFQEFLKEIKMRFKIMSVEVKVSFNEKSTNENYLRFVNQLIKENLSILSQFTYSYLSFEFSNLSNYGDSSLINQDIIYEFKNIIQKYNLDNITLANHINFMLKNHTSELDDTYDYYDYTYYNKVYIEKILYTIFTIKRNELLKKLYKKKVVIKNILSKIFQFSKIYCQDRLDYSTKIIKNKKIIPFELSHNNIMIFEN